MKNSIFSAALLAAMFASGFALADEISGKIKAIDEVAKTVTLENGTVYTFGSDSDEAIHLGGFKVGDTVTIMATEEGDMHLGQSIMALGSAEATGKVKAVDEVEMTVTLEDGTVYKFQKDNNIHLGGFKPGDMVSILATTVGDTHMGESIKPAN